MAWDTWSLASRNNINNMKLLAQTNRQQTPTAAWARGPNLFFCDLNIPLFLMNKKTIPLSIHYFIFQYQDAPIATHHSADPVLALTDGAQSYAGRAFLFPSQYTHQCFNNRPRLDYTDFKVFISSIQQSTSFDQLSKYCRVSVCIVSGFLLICEEKVKVILIW